jgi:hypothetical protein
MDNPIEPTGLYAALARAQKAFPPIKKTKKATVKGQTKAGKPYEYDYAYADLADVLGAILPCLNAEGISLLQPIRRVEGRMYLVTELHHSSGQSAADDGIPLGPNNDPQAFGAEQSFARRQGVCGMTGAAPEENEDTQVAKTTQQRGKDLAMAQQRTGPATKAAAVEEATPITNEESQYIKDELQRTQRKASQLYEFLGQKPGTLIPGSKYGSIIKWLRTPIAPVEVSQAFEVLGWTPKEQTEYCEKKNNDWVLILSQLNNMIGAKR